MPGVEHAALYASFTRCRTGQATIRPGQYARVFETAPGGMRLVALIRCPSCCQLFTIDGMLIGAYGDPSGSVGCGHCEFTAVVRLLEWE
jgi:hypothetical protein